MKKLDLVYQLSTKSFIITKLDLVYQLEHTFSCTQQVVGTVHIFSFVSQEGGRLSSFFRQGKVR
jgi:hypothetical protein